MAIQLITVIDRAVAVLTLPRRISIRNREQWLPSGAVRQRRDRQIVALLRAALRAPYYARCLAALGIHSAEQVLPGTLDRLPFLDKTILRSLPIGEFLTVAEGRLQTIGTSGSTGEPVLYRRSPLEEADFWARWWRVYKAYGCSGFTSQVNLARAPVKAPAASVVSLQRRGMLPRVEHVSSARPVEEHVAIVREAKPKCITGYAAAIESVADYLLDSGTAVDSPRVVICGGMEVSERCRRVVGRAFGAPVANVYASMEVGIIAWSCPQNPGALHINEDTFVLEIVGGDGKPVPPGVQGEVVVTPLVQRSMPLLRYRLGDLGTRLAQPCTCGRGFGLMAPVEGRTAHRIVHSSGFSISAALVATSVNHANAYGWVRRYQLREEEGARLNLLVEATRAPTTAEKERLIGELRRTTGKVYSVCVTMTPVIPLAPNGKFQSIVPRTRKADDREDLRQQLPV
jgi:phenylacetate-CoA ligase